MIGTRVSHYRIIDKLGFGGMGEVYAAEDEHLSRRVAIKFPNLHDKTGEFGRRFQHEARAASKLTHANIGRIYDYGAPPDGRPFLVMELVQGTSLREVLRQGRLPGTKPAAVVAGVLRALAEAHRNALVHRDISLSVGRNPEAASLAQRVLESKAASKQAVQSARCLAGLAMARSGKAIAGRRLCEPAIAELLSRGDRFVVTEARMSLAEIALAQGDPAAAEQAIAPRTRVDRPSERSRPPCQHD